MDKYFVKKNRVYVIATLGEHTFYLKKTPGELEYQFVDDIGAATKTNREKIALQVINYYRNDTGSDEELVVLPVDITYELVDETTE